MYFYIITLVVLLIDLYTKYFVQEHLLTKLSIVGDYVYLQLLKNKGIAFSLPLEGYLLKILTIILIGGIFWYYLVHEKKVPQQQIIYGLIMGGALGNAYERLVYAEVTDFIGVKYFAVFNIADIALSMGIFILIIASYAKGRTAS